MTISDHCLFEIFLVGSSVDSFVVDSYLLDFGLAGLGFVVDLDYSSLVLDRVA